MIKLIACSIVVFIAAGCATPPPAAPVTIDQIANFRKGATTEAEVIAALGKPMTVSSSMTGRTLTYVAMNHKLRNSTFVPIVGAFAGGVDMKINSASFVFDSSGKLIDYNLTDSAYSANGMGQRQPECE